MRRTRRGTLRSAGAAVLAAGALVALVACASPTPRGPARPTDGIDSPPPLEAAGPTKAPGTGAVSLLAGGDQEGVGGPGVTLGPLPSTPHPVLAAIGFKSREGTVAYVESVEGAGGTWRQAFAPDRATSGGVSVWVGEGVTGGDVTIAFSGPLERGRLGWAFDAIPGLDPQDPFVQIAQSPMSDAASKEVVLPVNPRGSVWGFVMVGRGGGGGLVHADGGLTVLGRGEGLVLNVASLWSDTPRRALGASWGTPASNVVIAAEIQLRE